MAELLEYLTDSGVNRAENMLSTLIGPELDNNDNEIGKPEVDNSEENPAYVLGKQKVYEVEEDQAWRIN